MSRRPIPISIWQPEIQDGELRFVRPEPLPLGDHYASRQVLTPKRDLLPLRVCLFGESAAAGYLYAPRLTPAGVLEAQLRAVGGDEHFEVIDLARTNERLSTLVETVRAALQIQPDVLVIWVGNNWNLLETPEISPYAAETEACRRYARLLGEEGIAGIVRHASEELRRRAGDAVDTIALIARTVQIPVVLVVPEVNLGDWETLQPPTWNSERGLGEWYERLGAALRLLEEGEWAEARRCARSLIEIDGGSCSTSWRLLAKAAVGEGDLKAAEAACRAEIDAASYPTLAALSAPQAGTLARGILLGKGKEHGWMVVDLREVFARITGESLPGRRLFLDYCHLTIEGIRIAMAAVASRVLEVSGLVEEPFDAQAILARAGDLPLSPETAATACLGAALHTAHRLLPVGPKGPVLEHWLEEALRADPGVADAMLDLLKMRCTPLPAILTAAQRRNFDSPYRLLLQHGLRWEHLDADLLQAIVAVFERRGVPARERLADLLMGAFPPSDESVDLTEPPFLWEPLARFFPDVMSFDDLPRRGTLRCPWPEVSFCLIGDGRSDVEIEATVRLPLVPGAEEKRRGVVRMELNGEPCGQVPAGERWTRYPVRLAGSRLERGLNRLTLRWPIPELDGGAALAAAARRLAQGLPADLHPVFGEVFSLMVRTNGLDQM
jgi:hypothetical protein